MRHSRATLQPLNVPQQSHATLSGDITAPKCSPTEPRDTLGQRYSPLNVPQQFCAAPSGNTLPLFRRRNVRIDPVSNKLGDTFGTAYTLGRHYKPISFHNRAMRHSRATLQPLNVPQQSHATLSGDITAPKCSPTEPRDTLGQRYSPLNVPQQFCAAPSGNTLPLFRRRNVRIDPVMNMLGDTFGTPWATIQAHIATPIEPHCTFGRHYYVPERVVVDDGAAGCNCSHKKANNTCN